MGLKRSAVHSCFSAVYRMTADQYGALALIIIRDDCLFPSTPISRTAGGAEEEEEEEERAQDPLLK